MRPYHILAALGATTSLAQAQSTKPNNPDQVVQATTDCSSTTTTWSLPSTQASSTTPANFTVTLIDSPANGTTTGTGDSSTTIISVSSPGSTTATTSTSPAAVSSSNSAAAAAGEGLASDSSMLGLVIFFALSLCLL